MLWSTTVFKKSIPYNLVVLNIFQYQSSSFSVKFALCCDKPPSTSQFRKYCFIINTTGMRTLYLSNVKRRNILLQNIDFLHIQYSIEHYQCAGTSSTAKPSPCSLFAPGRQRWSYDSQRPSSTTTSAIAPAFCSDILSIG